MQRPYLADDAFLADLDAAGQEPDRLHIWWLGQSGFLVQWRGSRLLFDPYLSDSLTRKYAATDKPHERMTGRVIAPERLTGIQVVTSSHNHTDHLDAETLQPLMAANPDVTVVTAAANRAFAAHRLQVAPERLATLDVGQELTVGDITLRALPAAHETLEQDPEGRHKFVGYVAQMGPWTLYHSGDTVRYPGMVAQLAGQPVDVALLPINGSKPERRVAGNLDGPQAAQLAHDLGAGLVIPCHYDMFAFNTATPNAFAAACTALGQPYAVLRNGQRWSSAEPHPADRSGAAAANGARGARLSVSTWSLHRTLGKPAITGPETPLPTGPAPVESAGLPLLELPARLAAFGIHTLEICHFHLPTTDAAYLARLRAALNDAGVTLFSLLIDGGDITEPDHGERDLAWIAEWIGVAGALGAANCRVVAGKAPPSPATLAASVSGLQRLAVVAAENDVGLMTENWFDLLATPQAVIRLLDALGGELGLCFDFGNWSGPGKYDALAQIAPYARSAHAKCHFRGPDEPDRDDYIRCLEILHQAGFAGPYTLIYDGADADEWRGLDLERAMVRPYLV